jgi:Rrf2 family protein
VTELEGDCETAVIRALGSLPALVGALPLYAVIANPEAGVHRKDRDMRLSTRARYGLRAMTAIARRPGTFTTSEFLADTEHVSKKYLDAILGQLREAGLLEAARGQHGGYRLAGPARTITAARVVEVLEGELAIVPCVNDTSLCERASHCPTRPVWRAASEAVRKVLDELTLEQLASGMPAFETAEIGYAI